MPDYFPFTLSHLVGSELQGALTSELIDGIAIGVREPKHVEGRIPPGPDIPWHHAIVYLGICLSQLFDNLPPSRKNYGCRVFYCIC